MKSDYIEFHQGNESVFINKNMIVAIYIDESSLDKCLCGTTIECLNGDTYTVDENINEVIRCLE